MEPTRSLHAPPSLPATAGPFSYRRRTTTLSRMVRHPIGRRKSPDRYYRQVHADQGLSAAAPNRPLRVLLVIKCLGYGGAERLLVDMVAAGDRRQVDFEVAYVLRHYDVEADPMPVTAADLDQVVDVPKRIGGALGREVVRIGAASTGSLAGVDFYEPTSGEELDHIAVGPGRDGLSDQVAGHRVDGPQNLDVVVSVDLGVREHRDVIGGGRGREQETLFVGSERLDRSA